MARRNIVGERPPPLRPFYTVMKHEGDDDAEKLMREGVLDFAHKYVCGSRPAQTLA